MYRQIFFLKWSNQQYDPVFFWLMYYTAEEMRTNRFPEGILRFIAIDVLGCYPINSRNPPKFVRRAPTLCSYAEASAQA
jgi:hypothetical protein